jgi:hypothetical protein
LPVRPVSGLAGRRNETLAVLARRLGDQLLGPEAEAALRLVDADLVAPGAPALAEVLPELEAGVPVGEPACLDHLGRALEQPFEVDSEQGSRHQAERRERGVTAADRRLAGENLQETSLPRECLELRPRVGDRDEELAAPAVALPEEVEVRPGLQCRAGFRRGDEERLVEIEVLHRVPDQRRVRRVEDVEAAAEALLQDERRQA